MCYHLSEFETRENKRKKRRPSNSQEIATQVPLATNILKPTYLQLISNLSATYYKANLSATYIQLICNLYPTYLQPILKPTYLQLISNLSATYSKAKLSRNNLLEKEILFELLEERLKWQLCLQSVQGPIKVQELAKLDKVKSKVANFRRERL